MVKGEFKPPLIKLKYEHSLKDKEINLWRIGQNFSNKVANPDEMIDFKKSEGTNSETAEHARQQQQDQSFGEQLKQYFHQKEQQKDHSCSLKVLCIDDLLDAVIECVDNQETEPVAKQLEIQIDKLVKNRNIGGDPGDERIDHSYLEIKPNGDAPREMDSINMGDERMEDDIQVITPPRTQAVSRSHPQNGAGSSGESWYHSNTRSERPLSLFQRRMHSRNSEDVEMEVGVQDKIPNGGSPAKRGKRKAVPSPMKTPPKNILAYFKKRPSPGSEKQ